MSDRRAEHRCPRRDESGGGAFPGPDLWVTDRWSTDADAVRAKHDREDAEMLRRHNANNARFGRPPIGIEEYRSRVHVRGDDLGLWRWHWGPPRTCSYCGSVHPEDALRLLEEGWEDELAKPYKAYLNAPGTRTRNAAVLASLRDPSREPYEGVPSVWSPTPPAKLYVQHLSPRQVERLNELTGRKPGGR